jgi:hypothetical protein
LLGLVRNSDPLRRPVEEIRKAGERATSLTRQLLAFSRQQVLQRRVLDLNALVVDTTSMLRPVLGDEIEIRLDLDPSIGPVEADPGQLVECSSTSPMNARDAMPRGDASIETTGRTLGPADLRGGRSLPGPTWRYRSGMTERRDERKETRTRIFEPFFTDEGTEARGRAWGSRRCMGSSGRARGLHPGGERAGRSVFRVHFPGAEGRTVEVDRRRRNGRSGPWRRPAAGALVEDDRAARERPRRAGARAVIGSSRPPAARMRSAHPEARGPIELLITDMHARDDGPGAV